MIHPTDSGADPRIIYADIIGLPHWDSPTHPRMSLRDRAAQFAPYAALVGYGDMVKEEARETGVFTEPGEDEAEELEQALAQIERQIAEGDSPARIISYFVPDEKKAGGETVTATEKVRRIDTINRKIVLDKRKGLAGAYEEIDLDRIIRIGQEDRTE